MKRMAMVLVVLLGTVGLLVMPAAAATITFGLDTEFSGATPPAGTAPWVTATFEDLAVGGVQLTIANVGLVGTEFVGEFYFNFDPAKNAAAFMPSTPGTGSQTVWNSISGGNNAFKADGDGFFDFVVDFPPPPGAFSNKFTAGETFILTWGAATGLTTADFNFASVNGPEGKTGFYAAAHVQSIGPEGNDSGWIGDGGNGTKVPEPSTVLLLGSGLIGLAGLGRRKFRK